MEEFTPEMKMSTITAKELKGFGQRKLLNSTGARWR